jgi:hypothetical protein
MARRNRTPSSVLTSTGALKVALCERARVRRDRRYDDLFFSGVRTTKIYCRLVCPVRPAKAQNVTFYPSAAAAERDGFRPCLRCRPEATPFSPAWKGSLTTVQRAVRLIRDDGRTFSLAPGTCCGCSTSILQQVLPRSRERHEFSGQSGSWTRSKFQCVRLRFARGSAANGASTLSLPKSTGSRRPKFDVRVASPSGRPLDV